jgi:hypothetical protein
MASIDIDVNTGHSYDLLQAATLLVREATIRLSFILL